MLLWALVSFVESGRVAVSTVARIVELYRGWIFAGRMGVVINDEATEIAVEM